MLKYDNTHIFTGYLKQLLSSCQLPACRIYTKEFADYYTTYGKEDPRVIESFDTLLYHRDGTSETKKRSAYYTNYLKNNELYNFLLPGLPAKQKPAREKCQWQRTSSIVYDKDKFVPGLTKTLNSPGPVYDYSTHEYLGDYLRFLRDYHNINLMSLYNCFNNRLCNNLNYTIKIKNALNPYFNDQLEESADNSKYLYTTRAFDSRDNKYRIYTLPVKLFSNYTIAVDCDQEIEMFCGIYNTKLAVSAKVDDLISRTYVKVNKSLFRQPFLYDKLDVRYWSFEQGTTTDSKNGYGYPNIINGNIATRWDIASRETDLKLFIKVPTACKSSIAILEGDYRNHNDFRYTQKNSTWEYEQNRLILNFEKEQVYNEVAFKPISKLQLLAFNTGESYPFAERLIEYLSNSAITPMDEIPDNIKRVQKVMTDNRHYFKINGLWEDKMQQIAYDYIMNSGPINPVETIETIETSRGTTLKNNLIFEDGRRGYHPRLGHSCKSLLYDVLGYIDRDVEKWYTSWTVEKKGGKKVAKADCIQNADIYNGLFDN